MGSLPGMCGFDRWHCAVEGGLLYIIYLRDDGSCMCPVFPWPLDLALVLYASWVFVCVCFPLSSNVLVYLKLKNTYMYELSSGAASLHEQANVLSVIEYCFILLFVVVTPVVSVCWTVIAAFFEWWVDWLIVRGTRTDLHGIQLWWYGWRYWGEQNGNTRRKNDIRLEEGNIRKGNIEKNRENRRRGRQTTDENKNGGIGDGGDEGETSGGMENSKNNRSQ